VNQAALGLLVILVHNVGLSGYTFRRHKLRFMSNAKMRTTTLLRYGSSSPKSAAHIFGNPDCIFASRLLPKLRPLMADDIVRSFSYNLLIFGVKKVADISSSPT
jgi:hypothetical protein